MPQTSSVRYFASRQAYYTQHQGKQHCLVKGTLCEACTAREKDGNPANCKVCKPIRAEADQRFNELMMAANVDKEGDNNPLIIILDRWLVHIRQKRNPASLKLAQGYLAEFVKTHGNVKVKELKPYQVQAWLAQMKEPRPQNRKTPCHSGWGATVIRMAVETLNAALNWAVKQELITRNPIKGKVDLPDKRTRTEEAIITDEEHAKIIAALTRHKHKGNRALAQILALLKDTGARPSEIANATADDWKPEIPVVSYLR